MKKLFLVFHGRFPSEKAASLFTAKNAESFAKQGLEVVVVVPQRKGVTTESPASFYGVSNNFQTIYLPTVDLFQSQLFGKIFPKIAFWISATVFSLNVFRYLKKSSAPDDIVYSNEIQPLFLASFIRGNCFYEMHDFPESKFWLFGQILGRMQWVLIHNKWKLAEAQRRFPKIAEQKFLCEMNAVDISEFDIPVRTEEARKQLSLPLDKVIAVYTGHLFGWKGVDTLAEAASTLGDSYLVVFVGGTEKDIEIFKNKYSLVKNILVVGHKPHSEMPLWQKAADVLVLPNTAKEAISAYYTSPMKLFEYMASKKPIIASDIPSIREVINEKGAVFVPPDNAEALARAIRTTVDLSQNSLPEEAFSQVLTHTWEKRAERIMNFMKKSPGKTPMSVGAFALLLSRYLFSGFLAFGTNMLLLYVFKNYFHWWYLVASTVAFIISVLVSFSAQKYITFRDHSNQNVKNQMGVYGIIAVCNVAVNALLMYTFVDIFGAHYLFSQVLSAGIIAAYSLIVYRIFIFSHVTLH